MLSMLPLLIHSADVPAPARAALQAAATLPAEQRGAALETAARLLWSETDLDCADVRDLVGLPPGAC
jgi:hypothetical protein